MLTERQKKILEAIIKEYTETGKPVGSAILDKKYRMHINRYAKAEDDETIRRLWKEDIERGNVPGAYWAVMTHPAISKDMLGEIYGQVHMMGHDTHGDYRQDNKN